jgi:hypothetical protein
VAATGARSKLGQSAGMSFTYRQLGDLTTPHKLRAEARSRKRASRRQRGYPPRKPTAEVVTLHAVVRQHGDVGRLNRPRLGSRIFGRRSDELLSLWGRGAPYWWAHLDVRCRYEIAHIQEAE